MRSGRRPSLPRLLAPFAILAVALACATPRGERPDVVRVTLVGTNDFHGWIEPHERRDDREAAPVLGGLDAFAGYVDILRRQRPDEVVLLDAGDMFQGTLVANLTEGAAVVRAYGAVGYDAAAVGNHEFDYGPEGPQVAASGPDEDPVGNLKARIAEASFPFLAGNIYERGTGAPVDWPNAPRSVMLQRQGLRIGVIGLITETTPGVTLSQNVAGLEFAPLAPVTVELAKEMRDRGAELVVVTAHVGGGCNELSDPFDLSSCDAGSELFRFLEALPVGTIDAIVAGHSHQALAHFVHGVPAIQSHSLGTAFGVIELFFDRRARKVLREQTTIWKPTDICRQVFTDTGGCRTVGKGPLEPARFLGEAVQPASRVLKAIRGDLERVRKIEEESVGPILERRFGRSRTRQSALGSLVADAMRAAIPDADVAFTNSGGLRAELPAGRLTFGQLYRALPFDNRLSILTLTGAELLALFEEGFSGSFGVPQLSGIELEVATSCRPRERIVTARLSNGEVLHPGRMYRVVTNDFVATSGDGYGRPLRKVDEERIEISERLPKVREVVMTELRGGPSPRAPAADSASRIRYVDAPCGEVR